jgi:hypothetical protein
VKWDEYITHGRDDLGYYVRFGRHRRYYPHRDAPTLADMNRLVGELMRDVMPRVRAERATLSKPYAKKRSPA